MGGTYERTIAWEGDHPPSDLIIDGGPGGGSKCPPKRSTFVPIPGAGYVRILRDHGLGRVERKKQAHFSVTGPEKSPGLRIF